MSKKPTYIELEKRVKELEDETTALKLVERSLKISNSAIESSINAIGITDLGGKLTYVNDSTVSEYLLNRVTRSFYPLPFLTTI